MGFIDTGLFWFWTGVWAFIVVVITALVVRVACWVMDECLEWLSDWIRTWWRG